MKFGNGQKSGRKKGGKNNADQNSLKIIMEECFHSNRPAIKEMLNRFCMDTKKQIDDFNERILAEADFIKFKALCSMKKELIEDFKWMMELKSSLEPKVTELTGKDGEELNINPPKIVIITHESPSNGNGKPEVKVNRVDACGN